MIYTPHSAYIPPVDYLVIGHVTRDVTAFGLMTGGTVTYSALTARAMGLKVGVLTAMPEMTIVPELDDVVIVNINSEKITTFENTHTDKGRILHLREMATMIEINHVPDAWRSTPIVHLGPVAQEISPHVARAFSNSFIGVTPQGWLRSWDNDRRVQPAEWPESAYVLERANAAVISVEDVAYNETRFEEMAASVRVLAVTEGAEDCRIYWNGDLRRFSAPTIEEVDATGAGDIFATSFFIRLYDTRDPWESARYATLVASQSVSRIGLNGVPTPEEIRQYEVQITQD